MQFVFTDKVYKEMQKNKKFKNDLVNSIKKYCKMDFGDLQKEEKIKNKMAIETGNSFYGYYKLSYGKIYISTIADKSVTTINFNKIN